MPAESAGHPKNGRMGSARDAIHSRAFTVAATVAMLLGGAVSLFLGQDRNWDLRNYHLYNAYAWLEGRLGFDLAPAQLQSYFTPLIDVPYFLLVRHASAEWAGFVLGAWHGLNFALVALIAMRLLEHEVRPRRAALWLALAGCTSAAFLSELGSTMGDNTTAVFVLAALIAAWPAREPPLSTTRLIFAGICLGLAVALKLTNAIYAVGLGAAVLLQPTAYRRLRSFSWLTAAAVLAFAVVAGPWHWALWSTFGNPLFPQFNAWFAAPLAQPIAVADAQWGPRHLGELIAWPLVFTLDPLRVGTSPLPQVIWGALYISATVLGVRALLRGQHAQAAWQRAGAGNRFIFVFFLASFVAWMTVFNIHRYLVVLELLGPLMLWRLLHPRWPRLAVWSVVLVASVSLFGWNTWGHAAWAERDFEVERPSGLVASAPGTVLLVGGEPSAWMIPFLPERWRYVAVASNFPESSLYRRRVFEHVQATGGAFAIVPAHADRRAARAARIDAVARRLGFNECDEFEWIARRVKRVVVRQRSSGDCGLGPPRAHGDDGRAINRAAVIQAADALQSYGLLLSVDACRVLYARIGAEARPYQWCPVRPARR